MGDMLPARWLSASCAAPTAPSGIAGLRALFPVLTQHIQGHPLAYLDNAATTQMPQPVLDVLQHFERYDRAYAHFVGLYESGVLGGTLIHAIKG